jgi:hypothetical protein
MKFPNSEALTAMIEDELERGVSLIKLAEKIADDPQKITLNMAFFPLKVEQTEDGSPIIFIPLGTREKPEGISSTDCKYALVFDNEDILVFNIDVIKGFIKANYKTLEWSKDKWFDKMGFYIGLRKLVEHEKNQRNPKDFKQEAGD